ncbi:MAG TPA: carboxypeptidase-like regulatory domain-containing protein [Thermoanaerobaculia bacterium]|nr:carboxypeptidase-like regulatory domain-containing protein [Thermoanaerobaculia bacterium]
MKRSFALAIALLIFAAAHAGAAPTSGKVLFQGSKAPVPHALIDFSSGSEKQRAVTADDGSYYLPDLPAGSYSVTITYRGVKREFNRTLPQGGSNFDIAP